MIDITGVDLVKLAQRAYELSQPQGMGFLHFAPGPLADDEAQELVATRKDDARVALNLDYVRGRACKLIVFREGDRLKIRDSWFDHTNADLDALLRPFGISRERAAC